MGKRDKIGIIGYGRVGRVLARGFVEAGYVLSGVVLRNETADEFIRKNALKVGSEIEDLPGDIDFLVVAVQDSKIAIVAEEIARCSRLKKGAVVAHTAGALSADVLAPVEKSGLKRLGWHPLQTFALNDDAGILKGIPFGMDGDEEALAIGEKIATDLGGIPLRIKPEKRIEYHLAAVISSNLITGLFAIAGDLFKECIAGKENDGSSLVPLLRKTVENIERTGAPDALTGPIVRGDVDTVRSHLRILKDKPEILEIYKLLSRRILNLSDDTTNKQAMLELLD